LFIALNVRGQGGLLQLSRLAAMLSRLPLGERYSINLRGGDTGMTGATLESVTSHLHTSPGRTRLAIVADSALLVKAVRNAFRASAEFEVAGYTSGRQATAQTLLGAQPDVILLDDMNRSSPSIRLLRAIRADDQRVAVIVLCMQLDADWLNQLFDAGATAVISKATRPAALVTLVRETLSRHIIHAPPAAPPAAATVTCGVPPEDLPLTRCELEILQFAVSGLTNGEIARRLWVTDQTVKFHLGNIHRKLDVANRTRAGDVAHASRLSDFSHTSQRRLTLAAS
jgi:DNA-binding NarL/FixJ family response regulator